MSDSTSIHPTPAPSPLTPPAGAEVDEPSVAFEWTSVEGADNYQLQLADDRTFASTLFDGRVGDTTRFTYSGLPPQEGVTVHWRVRARVDGTWEDYGDVASFEVIDWRPSPPAVTSAESSDVDPPVAEGTQSGNEPVAIVFTVATLVCAVGLLMIVLNRSSSDAMTSDALSATPTSDTTQLDEYGVVDAEEGVYRIPIDVAITRLVEEQATNEPPTGAEEARPTPSP